MNTHTIIILEQSITVRKVFEISLKRAGFQTMTALTIGQLRQCWHSSKQNRPAIAIIDLELAAGAYQVIRFIANVWPGTIIFVSARKCSIISMLHARLAGAQAFLVKPVRVETLVQTVNSHIPSA